ncbi:MAG: hypothetical protein AAB592_04235, partial [Patescibacteria group bacterium]
MNTDEKLQELGRRALHDIENAESQEALYQAELQYIGRKGEVTLLFRELATLEGEEKKHAGILLNGLKEKLVEAVEKTSARLENHQLEKQLTRDWIDVTMPGRKYNVGHIHPLSQLQHEAEHIFSDMGFAVMDGPEAESEYYNFEGLNIPADHPARDMQDTFFLHNDVKDARHGRLVLRTQTSPVQIRTMEMYGAPLRVIVPGRTFRWKGRYHPDLVGRDTLDTQLNVFADFRPRIPEEYR